MVRMLTPLKMRKYTATIAYVKNPDGLCFGTDYIKYTVEAPNKEGARLRAWAIFNEDPKFADFQGLAQVHSIEKENDNG